jgi:hypothetical protein
VEEVVRPVALALLVAGCGGGPVQGMPDLSKITGDLAGGGGDDLSQLAMGDLGCGGDLASATYPAGPYGSSEGDVFPSLVWEGYVDDAADAIANTKPYGAYSSEALRRSGRRYGLIHVSEYN